MGKTNTTMTAEACIHVLSKVRNDDERFAALLLMVKTVDLKKCDEATKIRLFSTVNLDFMCRLLRTEKVPAGCPPYIYQSISLAVLSAFTFSPELILNDYIFSALPVIAEFIVKHANKMVDVAMMQMIEDAYCILSASTLHPLSLSAMIKRKVIAHLCTAAGMFNGYMYERAWDIICSAALSRGLSVWKHGNYAGLYPLLFACSKYLHELKNERKWEVIDRLNLLLNHIDPAKVRSDPWAERIRDELYIILRCKLDGKHRDPALCLAVKMVTGWGMKWLTAGGEKFHELLINLACIEVRMLLEEKTFEEVEAKAQMVAYCFFIIECNVCHLVKMDDGGDAPGAEAAVGMAKKRPQFNGAAFTRQFRAMQGAIGAVLSFLQMMSDRQEHVHDRCNAYLKQLEQRAVKNKVEPSEESEEEEGNTADSTTKEEEKSGEKEEDNPVISTAGDSAAATDDDAAPGRGPFNGDGAEMEEGQSCDEGSTGAGLPPRTGGVVADTNVPVPFLLVGAVRLLGAWFAEETSCFRDEFIKLLPYLFLLMRHTHVRQCNRMKSHPAAMFADDPMMREELVKFMLPVLINMTADAEAREIMLAEASHNMLIGYTCDMLRRMNKVNAVIWQSPEKRMAVSTASLKAENRMMRQQRKMERLVKAEGATYKQPNGEAEKDNAPNQNEATGSANRKTDKDTQKFVDDVKACGKNLVDKLEKKKRVTKPDAQVASKQQKELEELEQQVQQPDITVEQKLHFRQKLHEPMSSLTINDDDDDDDDDDTDSDSDDDDDDLDSDADAVSLEEYDDCITRRLDLEQRLSCVITCLQQLVIAAPALITTHDEMFTTLCENLLECLPSYMQDDEHMILSCAMMMLGLTLCFHLGKAKKGPKPQLSDNFLSACISILRAVYKVVHAGSLEQHTGSGSGVALLIVQNPYAKHWAVLAETVFYSMQALVECMPMYPSIAPLLLKSDWIKTVLKDLQKIKGGLVDLETRIGFSKLFAGCAKGDATLREIIQTNGGLQVARKYNMAELESILRSKRRA